MTVAFYEEVARLLRSGHTLAIATLASGQGSTPRSAGAKMIVTDGGAVLFSIGGGAFEALVIDDAKQALGTGLGLEREYRFAEHGAEATGMVCGGSARVLIEIVRPPAPLLIFGGGHVGRALARQAVRLGFAVSVIEDRPEFLERGRYPHEVRCVRVEGEYAAGLPDVPPGAFVAVVTRCHRTDLAAVRHAVGRGAAYVGLIGSRRKVATVLARAREQGTAPEALREVRGPIGLPIGAETPEEIAVSIAAEMIAVRRASPVAETSRQARSRARELRLAGPPAADPAPLRGRPSRPRPAS